jgi:hypothetical protein
MCFYSNGLGIDQIAGRNNATLLACKVLLHPRNRAISARNTLLKRAATALVWFDENGGEMFKKSGR